MNRPRIMLADTDEKYLGQLELKFLLEMGEKAELEIITEKAYFADYFKTPRRLEVLVVAEDLFDPALTMHEIANIFVLADDLKGILKEEDVQYIFKYSSAGEIYRNITQSISHKLEQYQLASRETKIVAVTSASGGTGKTTIALGIAASLADRSVKTLYIDAEYLQCFMRWLPGKAEEQNECAELLAAMSSPFKLMYPHINSCVKNMGMMNYLPPLKKGLAAQGLVKEVFLHIIKALREARIYDVIIVDTDSVFDEQKARIMFEADMILFVTSMTVNAVTAMNLLLENVQGDLKEKYIFICNDVDDRSQTVWNKAGIELKFKIDEYVTHIADYDSILLDDLKNRKDIQRLSYLIV